MLLQPRDSFKTLGSFARAKLPEWPLADYLWVRNLEWAQDAWKSPQISSLIIRLPLSSSKLEHSIKHTRWRVPLISPSFVPLRWADDTVDLSDPRGSRTPVPDSSAALNGLTLNWSNLVGRYMAISETRATSDWAICTRFQAKMPDSKPTWLRIEMLPIRRSVEVPFRRTHRPKGSEALKNSVLRSRKTIPLTWTNRAFNSV